MRRGTDDYQSGLYRSAVFSRCLFAKRICGAQYAILKIDEQGLADVDFRRVAYDVNKELEMARTLKLPYYEVYYESLVNGIHHTHNHDLLRAISEREDHVGAA